MTEAEWEHCRSVGHALETVKRHSPVASGGWRRKYRLLACYALRRLQSSITDVSFVQALDVAERYFDGEATLLDLKGAVGRAQAGYEVHRNDSEQCELRVLQCLGALSANHPYSAAYAAVGVVVWYNVSSPRSEEAITQADVNSAELAQLVREMFGNPFRTVAFDSAWRTDTAVSLARGMYESRDFSAIPILADALQDAGCEHDDVLNHCRDANGVHVRGCWVIDLVLGKS